MKKNSCRVTGFGQGNMTDPIFLTVARILTFNGQQPLTNATGFYFERDKRLFLVTSRHVFFDEPSEHFPDRIEIELHTDCDNLTRSIGFSLLLYKNKKSNWRDGLDGSGDIDVAVIELEKELLPKQATYVAFRVDDIDIAADKVPVGCQLLIPGFPLGFHDELHHMPVVRHAIVASSFGLRFQGQGYFLTDARTHRGSSGAPVVLMNWDGNGKETRAWKLLGVHSARLDVGSRDLELDEALGLNCAWYADILLALTE